MTVHVARFAGAARGQPIDVARRARTFPEAIDAVLEPIDDIHVEASDTAFQAIDTRFRGIDTRFRAIDTRFRAIDTRFRVIDTRFRIIDTRFRVIDTEFQAIDTHREPIDTGLGAIGPLLPCVAQAQVDDAPAGVRLCQLPAGAAGSADYRFLMCHTVVLYGRIGATHAETVNPHEIDTYGRWYLHRVEV
jgi:hypothetical protein